MEERPFTAAKGAANLLRVLATVTIARKRLLSLGILAGCLLLLLVIGPARFTTHAGSAKDGSILLYTIARNYDSLAWMHGADRFSPDAAVFVHDRRASTDSSRHSWHPLMPQFPSMASALCSPASITPAIHGKSGRSLSRAVIHVALPQDPKIAFVRSTCPTIASSMRKRFADALSSRSQIWQAENRLP